jgi:catechol 2,3-dioxygenase-like lactoylglutathione lyase family enzyme
MAHDMVVTYPSPRRGNTVIQLHHIALSVADLGRAIDWYGEALALRPTVRATLPGFRLAMLEAPNGMRIEVFEAENASRTTDSSTPTTVMKHHGFTHLALDVDELAVEHDRLVAIGATSIWDPRPSPEPGRAMAFVQDPEGNLIELIGPLTDEIVAAHPDGHGPH